MGTAGYEFKIVFCWTAGIAGSSFKFVFLLGSRHSRVEFSDILVVRQRARGIAATGLRRARSRRWVDESVGV